MRIEICAAENFDILQKKLNQQCSDLEIEEQEIVDIRINTRYDDCWRVGYITYRERGE